MTTDCQFAVAALDPDWWLVRFHVLQHNYHGLGLGTLDTFTLELEKKVHPKVCNQREGPYCLLGYYRFHI